MRSGIFLKLMLVLIFLALLANLTVAAVEGQSLLTANALEVGAFFAVLAANLLIAGAGVYFTTRSHRKREKRSLEWGRRGFLISAAVSAIYGLAPWVYYKTSATFSRADAMYEISLVLLALGISSGAFLVSFYIDYRRTVREGRRRGQGASDG